MEASNRTNEGRDFLPRFPRPAKHGQQHLTRVSRIDSVPTFAGDAVELRDEMGRITATRRYFFSQWPQSDVVIFSRHVARSLFSFRSFLSPQIMGLALSLRRKESGVNDLWRRCCFLYPRTSAEAAEGRTDGRTDGRTNERSFVSDKSKVNSDVSLSLSPSLPIHFT